MQFSRPLVSKHSDFAEVYKSQAWIEIQNLLPHSLFPLTFPSAHPIYHPSAEFAVSNAFLLPKKINKQLRNQQKCHKSSENYKADDSHHSQRDAISRDKSAVHNLNATIIDFLVV